MDKNMKHLEPNVNTQFLVDINILNDKLEINNLDKFIDLFNHPMYLLGWKDVPEHLAKQIDIILKMHNTPCSQQMYFDRFGLPDHGFARDYIFRVYSGCVLSWIQTQETNNLTYEEWKYLLSYTNDLEMFLNHNFGLTSEQKKEIIEFSVLKNPSNVCYLDENKSCYKMLCQMAVMESPFAIKYVKTTDNDFYNDLVIKACIYSHDDQCKVLRNLNRKIEPETFNKICRMSAYHFKYAMIHLDDYTSDIDVKQFTDFIAHDSSIIYYISRCDNIEKWEKEKFVKMYIKINPQYLYNKEVCKMIDDPIEEMKNFIRDGRHEFLRIIQSKLIKQGQTNDK